MSLFNVLDVASSGMTAQSTRLNVTASNLANAENTAGTADAVYKPRHPVFSAILGEMGADNNAVGVQVDNIVEDNVDPRRLYQPQNPQADESGYVYAANVNAVEEMANMISASRSYQMNVDVMNTAKQLLLRTLQIGE